MKRILIADDDQIFRSMLVESLERFGYKTFAAENGKIALEVLENHQVDLVMMDLIMPEKEGIETIIEIREKYPYIKIIAISGGTPVVSPEVSLKVAKQLGAYATLKKPFTQNELKNIIANMVKDSENENSRN